MAPAFSRVPAVPLSVAGLARPLASKKEWEQEGEQPPAAAAGGKAQQGNEQRRHRDEARDASGAGSPRAGTEHWAGSGAWGSRHQRTGGSTKAACLSQQKVRGSPGGSLGSAGG